MILAELNQPNIVLQVIAIELSDGSIKDNVTSCVVRVYYVNGTELEILGSTSLSEVSTGKWRYEWEPVSLAVGEFIIEYTLVDDDGITTMINEDLIVRDIATQSLLSLISSDLALVKQIESGRWEIDSNQMIFYDTDNTTPILTFDLFDSNGDPSEDNVFERTPV